MTRKRHLGELEIELTAHLTVTRVDRETGEVVGRHTVKNSITTNGRELFLDLIAGLSGATFENGNSALEVENQADGTGSDVFTAGSADSGYPDHSTQGEVVWRWSDDSTNSYTVELVRFRQGTISGTIFSEISGTDPFGDGDNTKSSTENSIYEYTLSISGDAEFDAEGLDRCLEIMTDTEDDHFLGPASTESGGNTELRPASDGGTAAGTTSPDSGYPSRASTTLTYQFTAAAGDVDSAAWDDVEVRGNPWRDETSPGVLLWDDADANLGTKGSNEKWIYTWDVSV